MKRLILCPACASELMDEDSPLYLAIFGPQGMRLEDDAILVSQPVENWINISFDQRLASVTCDGSCGRELGVSQSSSWFLEQKRALDNLPLQ